MEQNLRGSQSLRGSGDSPLPDRQGAGRNSYQPFRDAKMRKGPRSSYAGSEAGSLYSAQNSPRGQNTPHAYPSQASSPTASTAGRQSQSSKAHASQDGRFGGENRMSQANGGMRQSQQQGNKRQAKAVNDLTSSWAENSVSVAEVHTQSDKEHWEIAITRTREAEQETARAKLALARAQRASAGAQQLQSTADERSRLHAQLLEKAQLVKAEIDEADPAHFRAAEDAYQRALHNWNEFSRGIAELEAEAKQAGHDYETHLPLMETHRKKGRQLTEDYDENIRVVRGASDDLPHLQGLVQPAQDRALEAGYEVEALQVELSKADGACAPLEQPALEARQRHAAIAQELAIAREKLAEAEHRHDTLLNSYHNACNLEQEINNRRAWLLEQMETGRAELADMEARQEALRAAILEGEERLPALRASGLGLPGQLDAAEKALHLQYAELEELQNRCMAAEASYKEAVIACDAEEAVGAEASTAARNHMGAFEEQNKAFKLHEDNHAQLWREAKEHGNQASSAATNILEKLHAMVKGVLPANHFLAAFP